MSKGPTKAQLALAEAREWIEASKMEVAEREKALTEARSQLEMHETIYAILEKTFTRQPGKAATKKVSKKSSKSAPKSQRASSIQQQIQGRTRTTASSDDDDAMRPACVFKNGDYNCGLGVDSPVHRPDGGYAGYHPFVSPFPARNAGGRSSSPTTMPDGSKASSEVETESVSSATGG